jgi:hypothetical protein
MRPGGEHDRSDESACRLRLYVNGAASPHSRKVIEQTKAICDGAGPGLQLEVVDVLEHHEHANEDKIWVTPTLTMTKLCPPPEFRVVGDFSNLERVLAAFGLVPRSDQG